MIKDLLDRLVATYPTEINAAADMVALAAPWLLIMAAIWLLAVVGDWLIEWNERRCAANAKQLRYRTADGKQIQREIDQLWQNAPNASGAFWEPWRDTVPPAENAPRHRVRAGSRNVVPFPSACAAQDPVIAQPIPERRR
jgi:hypothetical protein